MTRIIPLLLSLFMVFLSSAQTLDLNQYSYVVVPDKFEFQSDWEQYQLNSMTKFYLEKSGFNAFLGKERPTTERCDGLYANVEKLPTFLGTKLQVVLKDCHNNEIYRSQEGRSKYKEFEKAYQDALRKAFASMENLNVEPKELILLSSGVEKMNEPKVSKSTVPNSLGLPTVSFSNYSSNGHSFVLRKIGEGYSLYKESSTDGEDLILVGKIVVMDTLIKFMNVSGEVSDASFDASGNLTLKSDSSTVIYLKESN